MKGFTRIALVVIFLVFGFDSPSQAEDELEDFIVAGEDLFDFRPSGESATSGQLVFVPGRSMRGDSSVLEATLVAISTRNGQEVWRAFRGEGGESGAFDIAGADSGKACAAGTGIFPFPPRFGRLFVACYVARTGALLWEREMDLTSFVGRAGSIAKMAIHADTVVLQLNSVATFEILSIVLMFDARDGSPL
jgi:outer membrane protein assembly factor BamB